MSFWDRIGFKKKGKEITQTPEEVGNLLFACACKSIAEDLDDPAQHIMKSIRASTNANLFDVELQITILYAAMNAVIDNIKPDDKACRVLDSMNNAFVTFQVNAIRAAGKRADNQLFRQYLTARYKEYTAARQEKRGPNELWPLSQYILKNLLGKETLDEDTQDIHGITALTIYYSCELIFFNDLLKKMQIQN